MWLLLLTVCLTQPAAVLAQNTTIAEASANNKQLTQLLQKTGLMPLLSNKGPYTFFVPSATALQQLSQMEATDAREVLMGHILEGRYTAADLKDCALLTTMSKQTIKVFRKKNKLLLNGMLVSSPDQAAGNGIMHTVSGLLSQTNANASML